MRATSTAKTTTSDIEVIQAEAGFSAVVTFFSEFWVQANVEECVADACTGVWEGLNRTKIADRLLNHRDQRFRLGYNTLKPVADLVACLIEEVSKYLDQPTGWEPRQPKDEEEAEAALSGIRQHVYTDLHALADRRIVEQHLDQWRAAFDLRGKGSTFDRAQEINSIYERGAPVASTVMTKFAADFVQEMRGLVHQAIINGGGRLDVHMVVAEKTGAPNVVAFRSRP